MDVTEMEYIYAQHEYDIQIDQNLCHMKCLNKTMIHFIHVFRSIYREKE